MMKAFLLLAGDGPKALLAGFDSPLDPGFLEALAADGIRKFIAYEIPLALARERYREHFSAVQYGLADGEVRILDYDGWRAFHLFRFSEIGAPVFREDVPQPLERASGDGVEPSVGRE